MEQNELIGKTVLSVDFGAGVITEISDLNMGAQDFYIIQLGVLFYIDSCCRNFFFFLKNIFFKLKFIFDMKKFSNDSSSRL